MVRVPCCFTGMAHLFAMVYEKVGPLFAGTHRQVLAQNDRALERLLLRADLESPRHHDEMLLYEERLSRPQLRHVLNLWIVDANRHQLEWGGGATPFSLLDLESRDAISIPTAPALVRYLVSQHLRLLQERQIGIGVTPNLQKLLEYSLSALFLPLGYVQPRQPRTGGSPNL